MNTVEREDAIYKVVINQEEQYAIWPAKTQNPSGWRDAGKEGIKPECLTYIKTVWTDMRPLSLRRRMEMTAGLEQAPPDSLWPASSEPNQQFIGRNHSQSGYRNGLCVHQLFEAEAGQQPNATALICDNQILTYRDLNARANQVAHYLQKCGVRPEMVVAICAERSPEMVVGILGILKAGAAYMALDPLYPEERLTFMLEDARAPVLLTQAHLRSRWLTKDVRVVCLDSDWPAICQENAGPPKSNVSLDNLAYVMYTSGSTGKPKGVMITHSTLTHFIHAVKMSLGINANDVYLQTASSMFVVSVRQLVVPLCQGGTVVIATSAQIKDPLALFELIKRRRVTTMDVVPSYWRSCLQALGCLEPEQKLDLLNNDLRQIVSGGEPLSCELTREWTSNFGHRVRLFNVFGQTETTGLVSVHSIPANGPDVYLMPIGRSIANTQLYVLDTNLEPVPAGVPGELHIAGPTLARGYLNRSELTAEKFIPHPFSEEPGARVYKTGDLVRVMSDGAIGFVGRIDHQVKIRGVRVELEEVEAVLRKLPCLKEAVVVARDVNSDEKGLVAYVVFQQRPAPTFRELRTFLKDRLPEYMVPSAFVALEALPRTPSGKLNRHALPPLLATKSELGNEDDSSRPSQVAALGSENLIYVPSWEQSTPAVPVKKGDGRDKNLYWLVFVNACALSSLIVKRLEQLGNYVITVTASMQFARVGDRAYTIDPGERQSYDRLIEELRALGQTPTRIVHLWSVDSNNQTQSPHREFKQSQDLGFYSLLFITQAIGKHNITEPIQIAVVSSNMQEVTGEELLCPEKATILGPCKVIAQEQPNITCRSIDVAPPETGSQKEEQLIEDLAAELLGDRPESVVAYRGGYRWVQALRPVGPQAVTQDKTRLREGGVYLITGGLGSIGLILAEYLARTVKAKLTLVGRSAFPARDTWEQWLATHDQDESVSRKIRRLQDLETSGSEVVVASADVSNLQQLQAVLAQTYSRFGNLHGVIHAAGIRDVFNTIQETSPEMVSRVFTPKLEGTLVLDKALQNKKLDFLVLCSSLASILGRFGQVDYCAANAFLNTFAYRNCRRGTFTVSINWDRWQDAETTLETVMASALQPLLEKDSKKGISSEEGVQSFIYSLSGKIPVIVVSKRDLPTQIRKRSTTQSSALDNLARGHFSEPRKQRLDTDTAHVPPRTDLERIIAEAWHDVLGVDGISIGDNFFDLGGHSLSAARLCVDLQKRLGRKVTLSTFFRAPTIESLARIIHEDGSNNGLSSIVALQTGGSRPPFFCVPVGLGSVYTELGEIAKFLGQDQPFYAFQNLIEHPTRVEARAAKYVDEIRRIQPQGPYLLGGICLGGVVAFEMAQQLVAHRQRVSLLALIEPGWPVADNSAGRLCFAASMAVRMVSTSSRYLRNMFGRASMERTSYANLLMKVLRNVWDFRRYAAQRYRGDIMLFLAEQSLDESRGFYRVPWPDLADRVAIHLIPGGRHEITRAAGCVPKESQLRVLAQKLRTCIDDTLKTSISGSAENE